MTPEVENALADSFALHFERHDRGLHIMDRGNPSYEIYRQIPEEYKAVWFVMPHVLCCQQRAAVHLTWLLGESVQAGAVRPTHYQRAIEAILADPSKGVYRNVYNDDGETKTNHSLTLNIGGMV